jgi:hypothetical protein
MSARLPHFKVAALAEPKAGTVMAAASSAEVMNFFRRDMLSPSCRMSLRDRCAFSGGIMGAAISIVNDIVDI